MMKLICLGDSITFGYGVRHAKRWTSLVSDKADFEVVNKGLNGDTTAGMLMRFGQMEINAADTAVFILGGANDIFYCGNTDVAKCNMGALIQQVLSSGALPIVGIPMQIGNGFYPEEWSRAVDFEGAKALIEEYRVWLMSFCDAFNIKYIDFGEGWDSSWFLDGLHPDERGHEYMAEKVIKCLDSII